PEFRMVGGGVGQRRAELRAAPGRDDRAVAREALEKTERVLMQVRVEEHLDVIQQDRVASLSLDDVVNDPGNSQGTLFGGELEQLLRKREIDIDDRPAMFAAEIEQGGGLP